MIRKKWSKKVNPVAKRLDDLVREIVFHRDEYKCWDCQAEIAEIRFRRLDAWPWYPGFQASHIFGRARGAMKWDPDNVKCACARCHELWHDQRFRSAKENKFRLLYPGRMEELEAKAALKVGRVNRRELTEKLEHQFNHIYRSTMAARSGHAVAQQDIYW